MKIESLFLLYVLVILFQDTNHLQKAAVGQGSPVITLVLVLSDGSLFHGLSQRSGHLWGPLMEPWSDPEKSAWASLGSTL